jgi:hypothetical protein
MRTFERPLLLALLFLACKTVPKIPEAAPGQMPTFEAPALTDEMVKFPEALARSTCNVLVLSFDDAMLGDAKDWLTSLRSQPGASTVWSMPVVGEMPLLEGIIRGSMKGESADVSIKRSTVPIFMNSAPLDAALRIPDHSKVWVGVLSKNGRLVGAVSGAKTAQGQEEIHRFTENCETP